MDSAPNGDGDRGAGRRALLVPVGSEWLLLDVVHVREVVTQPRVTEVPTSPRAVLGVFNLRGEIVPLFDPLALLGFGHVSSPEVSDAVVVHAAHGPAGMAVDGVAQMVTLGEPVGVSESRGTSATYAIGFRVATLLDLDELLAPTSVGASR